MKAKDLNLKEGDVVKNGISLIDYKVTFKNGELYVGCVPISESRDDYTIVSRAAKLWRDMTPEEKGALLLAHHEGKVIEFWRRGSGGWMKFPEVFHANEAYRVKPEPKVETKTIHYNSCVITFNLIDGEPDCSSVKMEKIK